jgi:hypothetical protein
MAYVHKWDTFRACMVAERIDGFEPESDAEWIEAFQYLIDSNVVWSLQGYFGRTAAWLINQGHCHRM